MRVGFAARALVELAELESVLSLPADTRARVRESLRTLKVFAYAGRALEGEWEPYRVWGGPWPWMLFVYEVLEDRDLVVVVTVRDARSSRSPTMAGSRPWAP